MARSKRSRSKSTTNRRDITFPIAKPSLPVGFRTNRISDFEDRRQFHPDGVYSPPRRLDRPRAKIVVRARSRVAPAPQSVRPAAVPRAFLSFDVPQKVLICVRRKIRKEVLHAFHKTGKSGQRKPRRNLYSDISCKR